MYLLSITSITYGSTDSESSSLFFQLFRTMHLPQNTKDSDAKLDQIQQK